MPDLRPPRWLAAGALGLAFAACAAPPPMSPPPAVVAPASVEAPVPAAEVASAPAEPIAPEPVKTKNIVLVTIDGVRWQELFRGADPHLAAKAGLPPARVLAPRALLPNLYARFFDDGTVIGPDAGTGGLRASGPVFVSMPGYLEILRGRAPRSCESNSCPVRREASIADEVRAVDGATREDVAVFASWDAIARAATADPSRIVLSAGRTRAGLRELAGDDDELARLLARGAVGDGYPGHGEYRPDAFTAPIALRYLELHRPRFLWLALGDADEWAHRGAYGAYLGSLADADAVLGDLCTRLDALGAYGAETTVLVTTDHGRSDHWTLHGRDVESSEVWLMARGGAVPKRGAVRTLEPRHLADLPATIRDLLALPTPSGAEPRTPLAEILPGPSAAPRLARR